jgi:integrase
MTIGDQVAAINARLKAAKIGVAVCLRGEKLSLRATLPPRPGSNKSKPYQQYLSLGIYANPEGLKQAELRAKELGSRLALEKFDWNQYQADCAADLPVKAMTVKDWVEKYERDYFNRRERTPQSETTWETEYKEALEKLPWERPLTSDLILKTVLATQADSRTRKRVCMVLSGFAQFAGLDVNLKGYSGSYTHRQVAPRDIPPEDAIVRGRERFADPAWKWVYGILATYGLRNHEVFLLDFENLRQDTAVLHVLDGKTGPRRVWPCYPEWREEWQLWNMELPNVTGKKHSDLGHRVSQAFRRAGLGFAPYNLRHAWAIRTMQYGWSTSLSSQQMGHSEKVHCETYHHWIKDNIHQSEFDKLSQRTDRPQPPTFPER